MSNDAGDGDHTKVAKHGERIAYLQKNAEQIRENALAIARIEEKIRKDSFWQAHAKLIIFAVVVMFLAAIGFTAGDIREVLGL